MQHELSLFPVRPKRQAGESLAGFISRHFGTNGYSMPKLLHDAVATVYRSENSQSRLDAWSLVCQVMGESPEDYRRMWIEDRFTFSHAQAQRQKRHWQRPINRRFQLCSECMRTTGVHLALWDLPLVFACPIHKCMLSTQCQCGKPISWNNVGPNWTCRCGQALTSQPLVPAPRSLTNTAMAIAAAANLTIPGMDGEELGRFRLANDLLSTYDVLSWLGKLVDLLRGEAEKNVSKKTSEHWRFGSALEDWPMGLASLLERIVSRWHRGSRRDLFVYLNEHSRTLELRNFLHASTTNDNLPATLQDSLRCLVENHQFLPVNCQRWIFNPALSFEQRQHKLIALWKWWKGLFKWIDVSDESTPANTNTLFGFHQFHELTCLMLINALINAAEHSAPAIHFRRLAITWPSMPTFANSLSPDAFLELISRQLSGISLGHRDYLRELMACAERATNASTRHN
ncbi:TniQ family protein [Comamonas sp. Z1]|uniref:TniQ family protein n=1 Tax=Comamonas sp. Z1 TaxID=2601246 RepID=UPI0011E69BC8|nr:TniQ family protein [Comamonas sp. Z1]TYK72033.1 TniQ family protein [Comamonas sp. Z1]